jgi:dephospho-CoA kinase
MGGIPVIFGLLGGIASGKSTVAGILGRLGAVVIDADAIAHDVLDLPEIRRELPAIFGNGILDDGGRADRRLIAEQAFSDPEKLRSLEALVHPEIRRRIGVAIEAASGASAVVIDAPLLLEGGLDALTDINIFVRTSETLRRARSRKRGWDAKELAEREARQAPLARKRSRADYVIENEEGLEELERRVRRLYGEILGDRDETTAGEH